MAELLAEDVVVLAHPELPNSGRFEGRDGYLRWVEPWIDAWQELDMEIEEITVIGNRHVLAEVHQTGHGRAGIEVSMNVSFLFEIRDGGEVAYLALHPDRGSALAHAEVRETA